MSGLFESPGSYDFYQALRLLEGGRIAGVQGQRIGLDAAPRQEVARLRASPSLGFPVNAIEGLVRRRNPVAGAAQGVEVTVAFMGALGASGVLPWHYTEYVFERISQRDRSLRDFVDTLQHRSLAFHYRAWRKYRLPFAYEAATQSGAADDVTAAMRAIVGLGTSHLRERLAEGADRWLFFAGLFARGQRTTKGLEAMLAAVTGHRVQVEEFVGRWQALLPEERSRLGGRPDDEYRNRLGASFVLGERVFDVLSGVHIRIGPMHSRALSELVPRTGRVPWLGELVRSYLGPDVDFAIAGLVERDSVEPIRLGAEAGMRLGGSAWLGAEDATSYDAEVPLCSSR
ncbi:MAG: type VI secretion system baseplate subunit TssG [Planctomycetes bacterium]|nr:type VI secretion system baseplate subunit TssG [Planctomycetota bacterium]